MSTELTTSEHKCPEAQAQKMQNRRGLYLCLVAVQTLGAAIVLVNGVPIYRQIARDFSAHKPQPGILWWAIAAVALIQGAYWLRVRLNPPMPRSGHVFLAHVAYFVARLSFVLASSSFAVMFLVRFDQLALPLNRVLMLIALLFSMFCWTLELERLAKALQGTTGPP